MVSRRSGRDDRGVSDVVGYVLLTGIVGAGLVVATLAGTSIVTQLDQANAEQSASLTMSQADARLSALSADKATGTTLSLQPRSGERYSIVREGELSVLVNGGQCQASIPLSSLRYTGQDGTQLAYEAGGIWRLQPDGSAMVSPPEVSVRNGTVDMTVVNVSGTLDSSGETDFRKLTEPSRAETLALEDQLLNGDPDCRRPSSLTIEVTSDFYRAWGTYLEDDSGLAVQTYDANGTVRLHLDQSDLPARIDDSRNQVVDLSDDSTATVDWDAGQITVDKDASNQYTAFARPVSGGLQVSRVSTFESDIAFRQAIDVVFVMDESGSMNFRADGDSDSDWCNYNGGSRYGGPVYSDCTSKMDVAKDATLQFVGKLNATYDRVGVVGFADPEQTRYVLTADGRYIADDFTDAGANGSVKNLVTGGGTHSATGIRKANALFDLKSDSSRKKVMVLLSDGQDDFGADDPVDEAAIAAQNDITVHTVGLGAADQDKLSAIAAETGGTYHYVDDASGLNAVFDEVFAEIAETDVVVNEPVTLQSTVAGTSVPAQVGDNPDYVALANGQYNVNDPASAAFSVAISPEDGALVEMQATEYECEKYRATDLVVENETTGEQYREIRCVDIDESSATSLPPSNVSIYIDGNDSAPLLAESAPWWEGNLDQTLAPYLDGDDRFDLQSNQAVVVFDFGSTEGTKKRLIMLYEIGISNETRASDVVNVNVVTVQAESG